MQTLTRVVHWRPWSHKRTKSSTQPVILTLDGPKSLSLPVQQVLWEDIDTDADADVSCLETSFHTASSVPEVEPSAIARLPTEILDQIFAFLGNHYVFPFLFNRATHEAAMNRLWTRINLGRTIMKPRIGQLMRTAETSPHHFKRVREFLIHVVYDLDEQHKAFMDAMTGLRYLDITTDFDPRLSFRMPLNLPPNLHRLTTNVPERVSFSTSRPKGTPLDQLTLELDHTKIFDFHVTQSQLPHSVWQNLREFRFHAYTLDAKDSRVQMAGSDQGYRSVAKFFEIVNKLVDTSSRYTLRRLEFQPAGYIWWGSLTQVSTFVDVKSRTNLMRLEQTQSQFGLAVTQAFSAMLEFPLATVHVPIELFGRFFDTFNPRKEITIEVPVLPRDLDTGMGLRAVEQLLLFQAFQSILPASVDARRIKVVLDEDSKSISPGARRRGWRALAKEIEHQLHREWAQMGLQKVKMYYALAPERLKNGKVFWWLDSMSVVESLWDLKKWIEYMELKAVKPVVLGTGGVGDLVEDDMLADLFEVDEDDWDV